jgi:hypothetical protein
MNSTQKKLLARYNKIFRALDKEARADRCKGDMFTGWDWPTLATVKPEIYRELKQIEADFREETNSLKQGGLHESQIGCIKKVLANGVFSIKKF